MNNFPWYHSTVVSTFVSYKLVSRSDRLPDPSYIELASLIIILSLCPLLATVLALITIFTGIFFISCARAFLAVSQMEWQHLWGWGRSFCSPVLCLREVRSQILTSVNDASCRRWGRSGALLPVWVCGDLVLSGTVGDHRRVWLTLTSHLSPA